MAVLAPASHPADPTDTDPTPLARAPIGWRRRIVAVDEPARTELEQEGIFPGVVVTVTSRTPLGGPMVVELGRTRLALSAAVAALILTVPLVLSGSDRLDIG